MVRAWAEQRVHASCCSGGVKHNTAAEGTGSHVRRRMFGDPGAMTEFVGQEVRGSGSGGGRVLNPEKYAAEVAHIFFCRTAHGSCDLAVSRKKRVREARGEEQCCAF